MLNVILYLFFFLFLAIIILKKITGNKNYIYFSRWVTWVNSLKKKTPNDPVDLGNMFIAEYKIEGKSYGIIMRKKRTKLTWGEAGACLGNEKWIDVTKELNYYGGFYKDFHMKDVRPIDINPEYEKLAFSIGGDIIHVSKNEVIVTELMKYLPK